MSDDEFLPEMDKLKELVKEARDAQQTAKDLEERLLEVN